mgnify:FL=1
MSNAAKDDESLEEEFRETFKRLAAGDKEMVELWKRFTGVSIERLNEVMERLLVKYDYAVGESFYEWLDLPPVTDQPNLPKPECVMSEIVEELIDKWIATRNDDGSAGITFPKESKLPSVMLQKRNGTHGYLASDLSTIRYRKIVWDVSKIIVCTDVPQKLHFQQVFWTTKQAGWWFENVELYHSINGSVRLKEWAMSTRKGRIVRLEEVLDEGEARVSEILKEKGRELDASDIAGISVWAIKYAFLAQDRERDIIFDWDKILAFEGNSGPYVQYSIVRIRKLLEQLSDIKDVKDTPELTQYDKKLVQDLLFFEAELDQAATTYKFHGLVSYCYEMANHVNSFYTNTGKLTEEKNTDLKAFRVQLLRKILSVFELSFEILALPIPNKM